MLKHNIPLNPGEKVVYKLAGLQHGMLSGYSEGLTVTNQGVILEQGMFDSFKNYKRYDYANISQAIYGTSRQGMPQLEIYVDGKVETFVAQAKDKDDLNVLSTAINDQMSSDGEGHDYQYYQDLKQENRYVELRQRAEAEPKSDSNFAGEAVANFIKSGNYSIGGAVKAAAKATTKTAMFNGVFDGVEDQLVNAGNQMRKSMGLKAIMTNAEKKELQELESQHNRRVALQDKASQSQEPVVESGATNSTMSVNDQIAALKQLKELMDAGILTQDEFNQKKQQILGN